MLSQHIGAPAVPTVKVGDTVSRGDTVAQPAEGNLSVALHASIDGRVTEVTDRYITVSGRKETD